MRACPKRTGFFCVLLEWLDLLKIWNMKLIPENLVSLIGSPISIYANAVDGLIGEVLARLKSGEVAVMPTAKLVSAGASEGDPTGNTSKSVMIIPVFKFISDQDIEGYGILGTKTIQNLIKAANADDSIAGIVLHITNPGGTVMNTTETARDIFASAKPIVAFCEKLSASSGYYLTAACRYVFASGPTTLIGNIGTKSQGMDMSGILEKFGAKSWEIFADESFDKDLGFAEAMAGKPEKYKASILAPYAKMFMDDMKQMRPQIKEEALHGMIYVAETAIEMGLVDEIGSMEDALAKVMELSNSAINSQSNSNNIMKKVTMSVPELYVNTVKALGGVEVTNATENADISGALLAMKTSNEGEIAGLNAKITALTTEKTTAEGKVTTLEATVADLTGKNTALESEKTTLSGEIVTLKGSTPGALRSAARVLAVEGQQAEPEGSGDLKDIDPKVQAANNALEAHMKENFGHLD